jgi:DNA-directed RNA polymerase specialized sigma24 family protein
MGEVPDERATRLEPEPAGMGDNGIWDRVRALPPKQRTAVALRYVVDAPYEEISAAMQTSEAAARRNVHEGLKRLRMEYQR